MHSMMHLGLAWLASFVYSPVGTLENDGNDTASYSLCTHNDAGIQKPKTSQSLVCAGGLASQQGAPSRGFRLFGVRCSFSRLNSRRV